MPPFNNRPTTVGRYRIVGPLGSGGMGTVSLAYDPVRDQQVALKLLTRLGGETEQLRERFNREMRLTGDLLHPNIAAIYDTGVWQGQPFVVMEYVAGRTLAQILRERQTLTLERCINLLDQLCQGLHCAHVAGVIHRDIKPSNLMVTPDWVLKVVDFGIARLAEAGATHMTFAGTWGYMSPEQIKAQLIDHRSDIFAVGVVAYELMSLQRPFRGATREQLIAETLNAVPHPLDRVVDGLTPAIGQVISRALAKDPRDRFDNLEEMRVALRSACAELSDAAMVQPLRLKLPTSSDRVADNRRVPDRHTEQETVAATPQNRRETAGAQLPTNQPVAMGALVRAGIATRLARNLIVTALGLTTSTMTAFLIALIDLKWHVKVYAVSLVVIPAGAILCGLVAASGYYAGAFIARRRPTASLLVNILLVSTASYWFVWYLGFRFLDAGDGSASQITGFSEFVLASVRNVAIYFGQDFHLNVGIAGGVVVVILQMLGFALGGAFVFVVLMSQPYCRRCQRYLSSPVVAKGFGSLDAEVTMAYEQIRRFAASGNPTAAVALIRSLPQEELSYQLAMRSWRCANCAREYFEARFLEYHGGRWRERSAHTLSALSGAAEWIGARDFRASNADDGTTVASAMPITHDWSEQAGRNLAFMVVAVAIMTAFGLLTATKVDNDFATAMKAIGKVESEFGNQFDKWREAKPVDGTRFADTLIAELIPMWTTERGRLLLIPAPEALPRLKFRVLEYMDLREAGWRLLARGVRSNDPAIIQQWWTKDKASALLLQSIFNDLEGAGYHVPEETNLALSSRIEQLNKRESAVNASMLAQNADARQIAAFRAELKMVDELENVSFRSYNDAVRRLQAREIEPAIFAGFIQQQLLAPWNDERARLSKLTVPATIDTSAKDILRYMALKAESWRLIAEGMRTNNPELVRRGNQKQSEAAWLSRTSELRNAVKAEKN